MDTRRQVRAFGFYARLLNHTWLPPSSNVLWVLLEPPSPRELSLVRGLCVKDVIKFTQLSDSYYSKRPFASDSRLGALPKDIFCGATVLDIGCNEGWVTCEIGNYAASSVPTINAYCCRAVRK